MNCSENTTYGRKVVTGNSTKSIRQKTYQEKILKLLIITLILGIIIGSIGTTIVFKVSSKNTEQIESAQEDLQKYGTLDGKVFDSEMSMDWSSGSELGFVPLDVNLDKNLQEFIYCLSYGYNIDFPFVMGLIQKESSFKSDTVSKTNDYGLMQINTINHEWLSEKFGFNDYLDPYQNTRAGLYILRKLFEKYEDPSKVLMAYNMGETGAKKLWDKGIFETGYSVSVLENAAAFAAEIERMNEND